MARHDIPAITSPLGRYWDQPSRQAILVDETHTIMTRATFEQLADYSVTVPTGVYTGKMWRCGRRWLRWYDDHPALPDRCTIHEREILVVEEG